jgi:hypothetical protein
MSEGNVVDWKILVNQGRNEYSCRDELSQHPVFTGLPNMSRGISDFAISIKNDEEPQNYDAVCGD